MKKRIFAMLLALVMVVGLLPTVALAEDEQADKTPAGHAAEEQLAELIAALPDPADIDPLDETQGTKEDPWDISAEGDGNKVFAYLEQNNQDSATPTYTLVIFGTGKMMDLDVTGVNNADTPQEEWKTDTRPWGNKIYQITKVVIEEGVLNVGKRSLKCAKNLKEVIFPAGLETIGFQAFHYCPSIQDISIPNTVTEIMQSAFQGIGTSTIRVPGNVKTIGPYAFSECKNLTSLTIESGVETISNQAFSATDISTVVIPDTVTTMGMGVFYSCRKLEKVVLPTSITSIGKQLFQFSGLKDIILPNSINTIDDDAFLGAKELEAVFIPESVTKIGTRAFQGIGTDKSPIIYLSNSEQINLMSADTTSGNYTSTTTALAVTDGGTFPANYTFTAGTLADPIKDGCIFDKWHTKDGTTSDDWGDLVTTPAVNNTYYAKWKDCDHDTPTYAYTVNDNVLSAICQECHHVFATATINAPAELTYDGKAKEAAVTTTDGWAGDVPEIRYYSGETALDSAPVEPGTYTASISAGGAAASVTFTITRDEPETPDRPVLPPIILPPVISPIIPTMPGLPFTDVAESAWYYDAVEYVYETGLMDGVGGGKFAPASDVTRGMVVTILYRLEGSPRVYSDGATWWSDARVWAMESGISDGTNMDGKITREQLAAMLCRNAELSGADTSARANLSRFVDSGSVSSWAQSAMQWANAEGIVSGKPGSKLDPKGLATRAEVAAMFMRLNERIW